MGFSRYPSESPAWRPLNKGFVLLSVLTLFLSGLQSETGGFSQRSVGESWSNPEMLFRISSGQSDIIELFLQGDKAGVLHLWWPLYPLSGEFQAQLTDTSLYYSRLVNGRWTSPRDVMFWPTAPVAASFLIGEGQIVHALLQVACLSYMQTQYRATDDPHAWLDGLCIDDHGNTGITAAQGPDGMLYVIYSQPGTTMFRLARSRDQGQSWEFSDLSYPISSITAYVHAPALAVDEEGNLHFVWSPASPPDGYPLLGVYYTRSNDQGSTWSTPIQLADERQGDASLAVWNDEVHVLWNGDAAIRGRYYRYSADGGQSWEPAEKLGSEGGLQRPPGLIVDNRGSVHALLHEQENLYYAVKQDGRWTGKEPLYDPDRMSAAEIFAVEMAITSGNILHTAYILAERGSYDKAIYHQYRPIDAHSESAAQWPDLGATALAPPISSERPSEILEPTLHPPLISRIQAQSLERGRILNPASPILLSTLLTILIIGTVLLLHRPKG